MQKTISISTKSSRDEKKIHGLSRGRGKTQAQLHLYIVNNLLTLAGSGLLFMLCDGGISCFVLGNALLTACSVASPR